MAGTGAVRDISWNLRRVAGSRFYGFDSARRETVIDPNRTWWPHSTYGGIFGTSGVKSLITQSGGGYTFAGQLLDKDGKPIGEDQSVVACPATRRMTGTDYGVVPDQSGRFVYVVDKSTGEVWNPGKKPTLTALDQAEVDLGQGYAFIKGKKDGVTVQQFVLTSIDDPIEIRQITIHNEGEARDIEIHEVDAFCTSWGIDGYLFNNQREYNVGKTAVAKQDEATVVYHDTEYVHGIKNHFAFRADYFGDVDGVETDALEWAGPNEGMQRPHAIYDHDYVFPNKERVGGRRAAIVKKTIHLEKGQTVTLHSILGYSENAEAEKFDPASSLEINRRHAKGLIEKYRRPEAIRAAFERVQQANAERHSALQVETEVPALNNLMNWLLPFQVGINYEFSRSTSTVEPGKGRGLGFRDSSQDAPAYKHMAYEQAKQRMLDIIGTMFKGGNFHQYMPITKQGNSEIGGEFSDDMLWPILSFWALIAEKGDLNLLDQIVRWSANPKTGEKLSDSSVLDHLKRAIDHILENLGPHNLPLIFRGDWNDCLNLNIDLAIFLLTGGSYQCAPQIKENRVAESVMVAGLFVDASQRYAQLCRLKGDVVEAARVEGARERMIETLKQHAWCDLGDGKGYWGRAFDRHGQKIGFWDTPKEGGKIFVEGNAWCSLAGVGAEAGLRKKALAAVKEYLVSEFGIALHWPAFARFDGELGEISAYEKGVKENAGVFVHNNFWIIIALLMEGDRESVELAWYLVKAVTPPFFTEERAKVHRVDVTGVPQMISGPESTTPGEARNPTLTGAAGWEFIALSEHMFGIRPELEGLRLDPKMPLEFGKVVKATRKFQGDVYEITIDNPDQVPSGVLSVTIDGVENPDGTLLKPFKDGRTHKVVVKMGAPKQEEKTA